MFDWVLPAMADYYIRRGSKLIGPVSPAKLRDAAAAGKVQPEDEVRKGESGRWRAAESIKGLLAVPEPVDEWDELASLEAASLESGDYAPDVGGSYDSGSADASAHSPSLVAKPRASKPRARRGSGTDTDRVFWIVVIVGAVLVLVLVAAAGGVIFPAAGVVVVLGIHGVAAILGFIGGIWLLLLAFEEDAMTGLLYLFLPCFSVYFFFSRFDGSMPFRLTIASWVLSLIAVIYGVVIGAAVGIP